MKNAEKLQAVINTIEKIEIKATADQAGKILGIHRILSEVRDDLMREDAKDAGEADAE